MVCQGKFVVEGGQMSLGIYWDKLIRDQSWPNRQDTCYPLIFMIVDNFL